MQTIFMKYGEKKMSGFIPDHVKLKSNVRQTIVLTYNWKYIVNQMINLDTTKQK